MATLEMARSGPVISVWEVVRFNMADSTSQQTGFNRLIAVEASKVLTRSGFGYDGEKNKAPSQSYSLNLWIR